MTIVRENGGEAVLILADLSKMDEVENLIVKTVETYGTINILINNAAFYSIIPILDLSLEEMQYAIDVNLKAPYMKKDTTDIGCVVNISSVAGAQSKYGCTAYALTKHAVVGLTCAMGRELGPEIRTKNPTMI